ncbi:hypothetical protein TgHK011_004590 [Trichoderma gracile]|nr:hypothetical protein TgHK011_004590 [Trichoderma gracile]
MAFLSAATYSVRPLPGRLSHQRPGSPSEIAAGPLPTTKLGCNLITSGTTGTGLWFLLDKLMESTPDGQCQRLLGNSTSHGWAFRTELCQRYSGIQGLRSFRGEHLLQYLSLHADADKSCASLIVRTSSVWWSSEPLSSSRVSTSYRLSLGPNSSSFDPLLFSWIYLPSSSNTQSWAGGYACLYDLRSRPRSFRPFLSNAVKMSQREKE